jgi:hypothetical protein
VGAKYVLLGIEVQGGNHGDGPNAVAGVDESVAGREAVHRVQPKLQLVVVSSG